MAGGEGWFSSNYWNANYWQANYWAPAGAQAGDYWAVNYWDLQYWADSYWRVTGGPGEVVVNDDATLALAQFEVQVTTGTDILATTASLDLTDFAQAVIYSAGFVFSPPVSESAVPLTLTAYSTGVGTSGYIVGDVDLFFSPESTITITVGVLPDAPSRSLTAFAPTVSTPDGLSVGVGQSVEYTLTGFDVLANNNVSIQPVPANLSLANYDSPAAGIGELIELTPAFRLLNTANPIISGVPVANVRVPNVAQLSLNPLLVAATGTTQPLIPDPTFPGDDSIENANAATYPSNYEICDRTGFKLRRGMLREEWDGTMVRPKSWERRHPQDFVRGVGGEQEGSKRPEQDDRFVSDQYPTGVSADDL